LARCAFLHSRARSASVPVARAYVDLFIIRCAAHAYPKHWRARELFKDGLAEAAAVHDFFLSRRDSPIPSDQAV